MFEVFFLSLSDMTVIYDDISLIEFQAFFSLCFLPLSFKFSERFFIYLT